MWTFAFRNAHPPLPLKPMRQTRIPCKSGCRISAELRDNGTMSKRDGRCSGTGKHPYNLIHIALSVAAMTHLLATYNPWHPCSWLRRGASAKQASMPTLFSPAPVPCQTSSQDMLVGIPPCSRPCLGLETRWLIMGLDDCPRQTGNSKYPLSKRAH